MADGELTALEAQVTRAAADKKAADDKAEADRKAAELKAAEAAKKPKTEEEYLADAPESIRTLVAESKAAKEAEKADLVAVLKAAQKAYTEDELKAMDLPALRKVSKLLEATTPVVDYSGRAPRLSTEKKDVPYIQQPPPDGYRIALEKKNKGGEKDKVN
jgi:hypothetical protein